MALRLLYHKRQTLKRWNMGSRRSSKGSYTWHCYLHASFRTRIWIDDGVHQREHGYLSQLFLVVPQWCRGTCPIRKEVAGDEIANVPRVGDRSIMSSDLVTFTRLICLSRVMLKYPQSQGAFDIIYETLRYSECVLAADCASSSSQPRQESHCH
jgi:hypothetical protein